MTTHTIQLFETRRVGLFVTCLVNTLRPSVGFAALALLEQAHCEVEVSKQQTCCGQPAFNSGDDDSARAIAKTVIKHYSHYDYIVVPSGSCAAMIKKDYVELFENDAKTLQQAQALADKTYELLQFLVDVCDYTPEDITLNESYTYHDSCSGYRSLGVFEQPRKMLTAVEGLEHKPLKDHNECCGFGGTFCVKYSNISNAVVEEKTDNINASGANLLLGGDVGCLLNMEGKLHRQGQHHITALHTAEVLAGMAPELIEEAKHGR